MTNREPNDSANKSTLAHIEYDGKYTVSYRMSDGTEASFRVFPDVGKKIEIYFATYHSLIDAVRDLIKIGRFDHILKGTEKGDILDGVKRTIMRVGGMQP